MPPPMPPPMAADAVRERADTVLKDIEAHMDNWSKEVPNDAHWAAQTGSDASGKEKRQ